MRLFDNKRKSRKALPLGTVCTGINFQLKTAVLVTSVNKRVGSHLASVAAIQTTWIQFIMMLD